MAKPIFQALAEWFTAGDGQIIFKEKKNAERVPRRKIRRGTLSAFSL